MHNKHAWTTHYRTQLEGTSLDPSGSFHPSFINGEVSAVAEAGTLSLMPDSMAPTAVSPITASAAFDFNSILGWRGRGRLRVTSQPPQNPRVPSTGYTLMWFRSGWGSLNNTIVNGIVAIHAHTAILVVCEGLFAVLCILYKQDSDNMMIHDLHGGWCLLVAHGLVSH
jgi:hypothetical protein